MIKLQWIIKTSAMKHTQMIHKIIFVGMKVISNPFPLSLSWLLIGSDKICANALP
jgi:hypothetical protein